MGSCASCANKDKCSSASKDGGCSSSVPAKLGTNYGNIKNVIGVISGKGGVGKSTVTGILATQLAKKGYKVGVLDADITGPSMPRFFGINEKRADIVAMDSEGKQVTFVPVKTELGIKVISMNLLMEVEDDPVIWRGPMVTGVLNQMFKDTDWEELDYLLIDMPPGTSDITLTVMQTFPIKELVIVSTPGINDS